MLSVLRIVYALAFVASASTVSAASECKVWYDQNVHHAGAPMSSTAELMTIQPASLNNTRLAKRLDTTFNTIASGPGACGETYGDDDQVVLLWNGYTVTPQSGWVSGSQKANCFRRVQITANGVQVLAKVYDGGNMNIQKGDLNAGCQKLWGTQGLLNALGAKGQSSLGIKWDWYDTPQ